MVPNPLNDRIADVDGDNTYCGLQRCDTGSSNHSAEKAAKHVEGLNVQRVNSVNIHSIDPFRKIYLICTSAELHLET